MSKELEDIKSRLAIIDQKRQSLQDQMNNLSNQKHNLIRRAIELRHGVKVGSVVQSNGIDYRVTLVETRWGIERPWLEGNPRKKDGTFGTAHRNLYDHWTLVESGTA